MHSGPSKSRGRADEVSVNAPPVRRPWTLKLKHWEHFELATGFLLNSIWLNCRRKESTSFPPPSAGSLYSSHTSASGLLYMLFLLPGHPSPLDDSLACSYISLTNHLLRDLPHCSLSPHPALYFFIARDPILLMYLISSLWFVCSTGI